MGRVGAVVEQPRFVPSFSGRANLTLLARSARVGRRRVDEAVARVGLQGREEERYGAYSLGMRQRLAIAATLLKDPALMVLDEPTNGLDPAGIRDIRDLVRSLGESGSTVLLSSHILAEVQQVCDSVSIVGRGRLLAAGRVDELVGLGQPAGVRVTVSDPAAAVRVLVAAGMRAALDPSAGPDRVLVQAVADPSRVTRTLADAGIYLRGLTEDRRDLESVFLDLTRSVGLPGPGAGS
jgi:ABC-2 type transport system ATP-binding protein